MAAYAATVTSILTKPAKVAGLPGIVVFFGTCNVTNYNATGVEITAITKKFKDGAPFVAVSGFASSSPARVVRWNRTDKCFDAFVCTTGVEVADDVNLGTFDFIAIGLGG